MAAAVNIKTVKAGQDYYATVGELRLRYVANDEGVFIYSKDRCYGGWSLPRFGGSLSPSSIRDFHAKSGSQTV